MLDGAACLSLGGRRRPACAGDQAQVQQNLAGALSSLFAQDPAAAEAFVREARQAAAPAVGEAGTQHVGAVLAPAQVHSPGSARRGPDCSRSPRRTAA